jgi:hypothetical protein
VTAPRYAELVGKLFAREARSSVHPPDPAARARAIAAIADALGARARRRRVASWSAGLSVAAAAALVVVVASRHMAHREATAARSGNSGAAGAPTVQIVARAVSGATSVISSGAQAPLADESPVPQGSRLVTPANGRATLAFSTGTNVVVGEGSDLSLGGDSAHQVLRLSAGSIDLHVAKLTAEQRFVVGTGDAEVEVRGTQFHVSIVRPEATCGHGTPTRVVVTEGVVVVRHDGLEDRIAAGEVWPTGCVRGLVAGADARTGGATARAAAPMSTLPDENDLYQRAVRTANGGDVRGGVNGLEALLAKYPGTILAESARAEIMKRLVRVSPSQAASAARLYLASYPKGASRSDAEGILLSAP